MNFRGKAYNLTEEPMIVGILNHTPDSFYSGSRIAGERAIHERIEEIIQEGGTMVDVGGYSSRPDAAEVTPEEEWRRVSGVLEILQKDYPDIPVSVDTFVAEVARKSVEIGGADVINDVSGGLIDPEMLRTIAELNVPYILMHMRGTPKTMQSLCEYKGNVADGVIEELLVTIEKLRELGVRKENIILDPGFGFSKTTEQNYELMRDLGKFRALDYPLYVGISRKSMIYRYFGTTPADALNGTTVLNTFALLEGAHFLRVHDVREAWEAMKMVKLLKKK
ncbi:Dihydropteroate synthase [Porphyromonas levii]|nr:Dihydropteroate synthase [Porphyromonas levii]MBR8729889.1 Dihydropteroate synthase [Porphyromonas levii]MBR8764390.1 Dihydropteroate synthase [Porphyromonas levii]MBR8770322.1 Dihydropteroate synthase [Porphyromonas levii]